uniref:YtxH domain-containing protein n=1 Tax=candidate division CPR3 bacterium TaxID=2268181 RepID=A0A7C4M0G0_UNCC3
MSHLKSFLKGVALGGLVGVAMGLFNAPKKGAEMQKDAKKVIKNISKKGKEMKKEIEPKIKKAVKDSKKLADKAKKTVKKYKKINGTKR